MSLKQTKKSIFDYIASMSYGIMKLVRVIKDKAFAFYGKILLKDIQKNMYIIGLTGTKGKTTTIDAICHILKKLDIKFCAYTTSFEMINGEKKDHSDKSAFLSKQSRSTMPGRSAVHKFIKKGYELGAKIAIIEATSVGLNQHRGDYIEWDLAAITNLQPEHLEMHNNSFESYKKAKGILFKQLSKYKEKRIDNSKVFKTMIANLDDETSEYYLSFKAKEKIGYCLDKNIEQKSKIMGIDLFKPNSYQIDDSGVNLFFEKDSLIIKSSLLGKFSAYNIMLAYLITHKIANVFKIQDSTEKILNAINDYKGPDGRMNFIKTQDNITIVVDYAHTPDSLENIYSTLKKLNYNKTIGLLGSCGTMLRAVNLQGITKSGGVRDMGKRKVMGKVVEKYCDKIILTNEDPYGEQIIDIINDIAEGIEDKDKIIKIENRKEAIQKGIDMLSSGDILVITGKGSEKSIALEGGIRGNLVEQDWEGDLNIALNYLKEVNKEII